LTCRLRPIVYVAGWAVVLAFLARASNTPALAGLLGIAKPFIPPLAALLFGTLSRSIVAGAASAVGLDYLLSREPGGVSGLILYAAIFFFLTVRAARGGVYDSVLEYLLFPGKVYLSPVLAAGASTALAYWLGLSIVEYKYYLPAVAFSALVAARQVSPLRAMVIGFLAGLGPLWAPAAALYASTAPLPPITCGSRIIGILHAVEAVTSPTRSIGGPASVRWKDRVIACSEHSPARVGLGRVYTILVFSKDWLPIATSLAQDYTGVKMVFDLDAGNYRPSRSLLALAGIEYVNLHGVELHEAISEIHDRSSSASLIILGSCEKPLELLLQLAPPDKPAIIGSCMLPQGRLFPVRRGDMVALIGDTGDPAALASILETLQPQWARRLADLVGAGYLIATPYCGPRLAVVKPLRPSHG